MHSQRSLSGLLHFGRGWGWSVVWDSQPAPSITPLSFEGVAFNEPLALFPQEADLLPLFVLFKVVYEGRSFSAKSVSLANCTTILSYVYWVYLAYPGKAAECGSCPKNFIVYCWFFVSSLSPIFNIILDHFYQTWDIVTLCWIYIWWVLSS